MDSCSYVFIFPVEKSQDIPADFRASVCDLPFETGVFLPESDAGWFTRLPKSFPRILLLSDQRLHIIPHPTSGDRTVEIGLQQLVQFETGNNLLFGWVAFDTTTGNFRFNYDTRASEPLERLLVTVKRRWLSESGEDALAGPCVVARREIDVKFRSILDCELDSGETARYVFFSPPLQSERSIFLWKRRTFRAGHLLTLTSQGRLLWLTDDYRGHYERYAATAVSTLLRSFQNAELEKADDHDQLVIHFSEARAWRIPISRDTSAAILFAKIPALRYSLQSG